MARADDPLASAFGTWAGRVESFDDHIGSGTVNTDGTEGPARSWPFHCTRIADGSRTIPVGTWVTFDVEPGPTGLEAVAVRRRA